MKLGFIGLGKMGQAMVLNLIEKGIEVAVYNRTAVKVNRLAQEARGLGTLIKTYSFKEFIGNLARPRVIWLMVEHGKAVDEVIEELMQNGLEKEDIVIDGGNSFYKDSVKRYNFLKEKGIHFLDAGTSGGLEGARRGACIMVGGDKEIFEKTKAYFEVMAGRGGDVTYFGPPGAGHFIKMVHNGVEYGMLEAIGEGFELLKKAPYKLDLQKVAVNWSKGSVVRGWLMDLLVKAFRDNPDFSEIEGTVGGGSTGEWTSETARELKTDVPAIEAAVKARKQTQRVPTYAGKVIQALRNQFGGHEIILKEKERVNLKS